MFSAVAFVWVHVREARLESCLIRVSSERREAQVAADADGGPERHKHAFHGRLGRTRTSIAAPLAPSPRPRPPRPHPRRLTSPSPPSPPPPAVPRVLPVVAGSPPRHGVGRIAGQRHVGCRPHPSRRRRLLQRVRGARGGRCAADGKECNAWVFCARKTGCGDRLFGECWLKHSGSHSTIKQSGRGTPWTSGMIVRADKLAAAARARARALKEKRYSGRDGEPCPGKQETSSVLGHRRRR